jgi:hypothetical protein
VIALRVGIIAALDFPDPPPVDRRRISVLLVAGHDTTLASDALGHVEVEAVLFAGFERAFGDQRAGGLSAVPFRDRVRVEERAIKQRKTLCAATTDWIHVHLHTDSFQI